MNMIISYAGFQIQRVQNRRVRISVKLYQDKGMMTHKDQKIKDAEV